MEAGKLQSGKRYFYIYDGSAGTCAFDGESDAGMYLFHTLDASSSEVEVGGIALTHFYDIDAQGEWPADVADKYTDYLVARIASESARTQEILKKANGRMSSSLADTSVLDNIGSVIDGIQGFFDEFFAENNANK